MFKRFYIPVTVLLSVFLFGFIAPLKAQDAYELYNLRTTKKLLMEYIVYLKPELYLLKEIDTTFVRTADLTFDGKPDTVFIHVTGKSIIDPISWTYDIVSEGNTIYHSIVDDDGFERLLGLGVAYWDNKYGSPGLEGFIQEKSTWYLKKVPERIVRKTVFGKDNGMFIRKHGNSIYRLFPKQLRRMGISDENTVSRIIDKAVERLQAGTYILQAPSNLVNGDAPRIFVPEVNSFLIFYGW